MIAQSRSMAEERLKSCACKGIRTCIECEGRGIPANHETCPPPSDQSASRTFLYCDECRRAWLILGQAEDAPDHTDHNQDAGRESIDFPGITIVEEFVTEEEERRLCEEIDDRKWVDSQSGRRKQDYGPKVNFKKKKLKMDSFVGLPSYSRRLVAAFTAVPVLTGFTPVELCNLEYRSDRGSAIDPHRDDVWLWGERLVTLNLLSSSVLTFTRDEPALDVSFAQPTASLGSDSRPSLEVAPVDKTWTAPNGRNGFDMQNAQNGHFAAGYPDISRHQEPSDPFFVHSAIPLEFSSDGHTTASPNVLAPDSTSPSASFPAPTLDEVKVPMPRRSLLVVSGLARYVWKHAIKRADVTDRRLAMTFRELTGEYLGGGTREGEGRELIRRSLSYLG